VKRTVAERAKAQLLHGQSIRGNLFGTPCQVAGNLDSRGAWSLCISRALLFVPRRFNSLCRPVMPEVPLCRMAATSHAEKVCPNCRAVAGSLRGCRLLDLGIT